MSETTLKKEDVNESVTTTATSTITEDNKKEDVNENANTPIGVEEVTTLKEIHPAILIMYAEFLGYVSPILDMAEKICSGEILDDEINKFIKVEASFIFKKMQDEYTLKDLRGWYDDFYDVIFKEYENNIKNPKTKKEDTKPIATTTNSYPSRYDYYDDWD